MIFLPTSISGVVVVEARRITDERGFFARTWCAGEFTRNGLNPDLSQCSVAHNPRRGTLRGLHFQSVPHGEDKLVRCTRGAIFDVALDLREDSPTRGQWTAAELSADNLRMLYIPKGCAHGFQTLENYSDILYQISQPYVPDRGAGYRFDDPFFEIRWPLSVNCISNKDLNWPSFSREVAIRN